MIFAPCCVTAATTVVIDKTVNTAIPDNNPNGLVSTLSVSGVGHGFYSVEVLISTQNGWNGDLYAYLEHDGVISVLLNRPGRTGTDPVGAASSGLLIRLSDSLVMADSHTGIPDILGTLATGTYQPDARAADPGAVTDLSPRSLYLSAFNTLNADGDWTLFVSDLSGGDVATLNNWSLVLIPEPSSALLFCTALPLLLRRRR